MVSTIPVDSTPSDTTCPLSEVRATSVFGPSRHFVCAQRSGRFQVKADIKWQARPAASVANDPERTLNRASDADFLPFHTRVVCSRLEARVQVDLVDLLESVSSVVRIF
jgi:hypothetical protein